MAHQWSTSPYILLTAGAFYARSCDATVLTQFFGLNFDFLWFFDILDEIVIFSSCNSWKVRSIRLSKADLCSSYSQAFISMSSPRFLIRISFFQICIPDRSFSHVHAPSNGVLLSVLLIFLVTALLKYLLIIEKPKFGRISWESAIFRLPLVSLSFTFLRSTLWSSPIQMEALFSTA